MTEKMTFDRAMSLILDKEDEEHLTYFWEDIDDITMKKAIGNLEQSAVKYWVLSAEDYMQEFFKRIESVKTQGFIKWEFMERIRDMNLNILFIYGYEVLSNYNCREVLEVLLKHDINSREGLLIKTVIATTSGFDGFITDEMKYILQRSTVIKTENIDE
ncbi:MAG: hypothetical protein Q4C46_02975 [Bacillota bacterium]|nr:hypothetical protein [Bacillota bacterium]